MILKAVATDIPALLKVINSAYRGDESKKGWTTEANLIDGDARTDEQVLSSLMRKPGSVILKFVSDNQITGCVHLENQAGRLHLGMLSVSPEMQGQNIGKLMMRAAEEWASNNNLIAVVMDVISVRSELIAWYEKHGYSRTGETKPFPADDRFGIPKQPLEFVVLEKKLN